MAAERQGSRWINEPPTEEQVKEWFQTQPLHPGMEHGPYLGGIVVIPATEKFKVTKVKQNGDPYVTEQERAVFIPYVKVDTRIAYFWDLVRRMNVPGDEDHKYIGIIEPVAGSEVTERESPYYNEHLPEGFGVLPVRNANDSVNRYLVCTQRVAIYERESLREGGDKVPVLQGKASKQTAMAKNWADDNALMKSETGAVGRALGMAGILVVGTGVATAEDIQEAAAGPVGAAGATSDQPMVPEVVQGGEVVGAGAVGPAVPDEPKSPQQEDEELRAHALELQKEMETDYPEAWQSFREWWASRKFAGLSTLTGPALRGAVTKLERDLDQAKGQPGATKAEEAPAE